MSSLPPSLLLAGALAAFISVGCNEAPPPSPTKAGESTPLHATTTSSSAWAELAAMDDRKPLPLQPMMAWHQKQNMMEHLVAVQQIIDGVAREDWDAVAKASARIESSPQMAQMCEHIGAGADGFTELALDFHRRADAIGQAAQAKDRAAALTATAHTLQACTGCHAAYRQDVVTAEAWQERTGSTHDPSSMHGMH